MENEDRLCQMARGPNIPGFKLLEFNSILRGKRQREK